MTYTLVLNDEKAALLVKILTDKAKEIHRWQASLNSSVRDEEYQKVCDLLKSIHTTKGEG